MSTRSDVDRTGALHVEHGVCTGRDEDVKRNPVVGDLPRDSHRPVRGLVAG
jgi:hypothetical protein